MGHLHSPTAVFTKLLTLFPSHWRRPGCLLGPGQLFISLMSMTVLGTTGYERTMREMRERLGRVLGWCESPSVAAFCQARSKLTKPVCLDAVRQVRDLCTTARVHPSLGYAGYRLLALDGTKLPLPAYTKIRAHFGCPKQAPQGPQASLTLLWDVGATQPVEWRLDGYRVCERLHAYDLVHGLSQGDLLLADGNFSSRRLLQSLQHRRADWLMHVRCAGSGTLREVVEFVASGADDAEIDLIERDHHGRARPERGHLRARLVRLTLPEGGIRVFITSLLDRQRHPRETLITLYAQRWRIETAFRELKLWHGFQNFHARTPLGIFQEVAAVMIFQLLSSELEAQARLALGTTIPDAEPPEAQPQIRAPLVRFNRRQVADGAIDLLLAAADGEARLTHVFEYTLFDLWRYRQTPKPGRSFQRRRKSPFLGFKDRGPTGRGRKATYK